MLTPAVVCNVPLKLKNSRESQKRFSDRKSKKAPTMNVGDRVRLQMNHRDWVGGAIVGNADQPRSHIVKTSNGALYRRNTSQLRPTKLSMNIETNSLTDFDQRGTVGFYRGFASSQRSNGFTSCQQSNARTN